jgi:hypothetical protein
MISAERYAQLSGQDKESCPEGLSTEPGAKKPIWNYHPPEAEA